MKWLAGCSAEALGAALRIVAPELSGHAITIPGTPQEDPRWHSSTAFVGDQFIAKFAWSRPAALRVAHEVGVLTALAREPAVRAFPGPGLGPGLELLTAVMDRYRQITGQHQNGSVTWPPASGPSASNPRKIEPGKEDT